MTTVLRFTGRTCVALLSYGLIAAVVVAPLAAELAVERVRFQDRLGTLPVEVSLAHNGFSTLDTGLLGRLYWDETGTGGFGAVVRATGPPQAGGTLSSYVAPQFVSANAQFISDPAEVARTYGTELRSRLLRAFLWFDILGGLLGGVVLASIFHIREPRIRTAYRTGVRIGMGVGIVVAGIGAFAGVATVLFQRWDGSAAVTYRYPMPGVDRLSFSSPQTLEIARQLGPFIQKNTERIEARARQYEAAAVASQRAALPRHAALLKPREGERIVIAEADPQGGQVGTRVRAGMYRLLQSYLGKDAFAVRTISGDVTSNGTVAEAGFVEDEAAAWPDVPVVAVKGDHDTDTTVEQFHDSDIANPEFDPTEIGGLRFVAANDPAFKALFGGLVVNNTGISEAELGEQLREDADPGEPVIVLLHQPAAASGYIGIDELSDLPEAVGRQPTAWDDEIPDLPPGSINFGHLHDAAPPRVIWNTDGDLVTWTVVNQLGTSGGVEENPTFNSFSTPFSAPLKTLSVQIQYFDVASGLQTGYAEIDIATDATVTVTDRVDLGLRGGEPLPRSELDIRE